MTSFVVIGSLTILQQHIYIGSYRRPPPLSRFGTGTRAALYSCAMYSAGVGLPAVQLKISLLKQALRQSWSTGLKCSFIIPGFGIWGWVASPPLTVWSPHKQRRVQCSHHRRVRSGRWWNRKSRHGFFSGRGLNPRPLHWQSEVTTTDLPHVPAAHRWMQMRWLLKQDEAGRWKWKGKRSTGIVTRKLQSIIYLTAGSQL